MTPRSADDLISTRDAARILGVTRQRVEKIAADLNVVVVAGRRFFRREDVERAAADREARKETKR